jgi:ribonucleoside-diphosphate reductase subunit M2
MTNHNKTTLIENIYDDDTNEQYENDSNEQNNNLLNEFTDVKIVKHKSEAEYDLDEPILQKENRRFTTFPIIYTDIWNEYKKQELAFWKAEEIDYSEDNRDYMTFDENEKHFIKMILAFFAASDGIVNFNLRDRFLKDVQIMEAQVAYSWQMMMENIHSQVYSLLLDNIIKDPEEKTHLFNAIQTIPAIKKMADWSIKWIESDKRFAYRLLAFAIVEGVFFSGAFASIYWIKKFRCGGKMFMPGLIKSNELIARDEGLHTDFACLLYSKLVHKLDTSVVHEIMSEAVLISKEFIIDAIPCKFIGMNSDLMSTYIEYISDRLLVTLGYAKIYNKTNPFPFMDTIGIPSKTNFFESRSTEYNMSTQSKKEFNILDEF